MPLMPVAPSYSIADDILLAQVLVEYSAGSYVTTLTDERQMRSVFITNKDSIDKLATGQVYGRVLRAQAEAINSGFFNMAFRKFLYAGKAWTDGRDINAFALMQNGLSMMMGTGELDKLWISDDLGATWKRELGITVDDQVSTITMNGAATFVGGGCPARIYRLNPPNLLWTMVAENIEAERFTALCVIDSMNMLAACDNDVYGSEDAGLTWTVRGTIQDISRIIRYESLGDGVLLAVGTGSEYIHRSTDGGATWSQVKMTSNHASEHNFLKHIGNGIVLFGDEDIEWIYRSTNSGLTWNQQISMGSYRHYPTLLVDGDTLLLPVGTSIYMSEDYGLTWTNKYPLANIKPIVEICKGANDIIVTISNDGDVFWGYPFNV